MEKARNLFPRINFWSTVHVRHSQGSYLKQQYALSKAKQMNTSNDLIIEDSMENIKHKDSKHRLLSKVFNCCRSCSSVSPCVRGLLLGCFVAGLILVILITIWLTSLHKNDTISTESIIVTTTSSSTTTTTALSIGWNQTAKTVAGTGSVGSSANQFNLPVAIALDSSKTLYVADRLNNRVQKWLDGASNGTTIAGSSAGTAGSSLSYLYITLDVELDADGNIYISDYENNRVVLWTVGASSGILVAGAGGIGSGNNQLYRPYGIVHDWTTGTLYIADTFNHRIMSYASGASTGTKCIGGLGFGTTQLNMPMGLYFDSSSNSLYITNNGANNIVRWVVNTSNWILVAGSSSGTAGLSSILLNYPRDVSLDSMKNIYVADGYNNRIVFFPAGQSTGVTIIGSTTGASGSTATLLNTPISLVVDSEFNVYVADYYNHRIQCFYHY